MFAYTWRLPDLPDDDPRRTYVEFTLQPDKGGTLLHVVEAGLPNSPSTAALRPTTRIVRSGCESSPSLLTTSMLPDLEAVAEQVFVALADPTRRAILTALASNGPATVSDLAGSLPVTRQAIAKHLILLSDAGLTVPEPGDVDEFAIGFAPRPSRLLSSSSRRLPINGTTGSTLCNATSAAPEPSLSRQAQPSE